MEDSKGGSNIQKSSRVMSARNPGQANGGKPPVALTSRLSDASQRGKPDRLHQNYLASSSIDRAS